jgi:hypothetical protein
MQRWLILVFALAIEIHNEILPDTEMTNMQKATRERLLICSLSGRLLCFGSACSPWAFLCCHCGSLSDGTNNFSHN